LRARRQCRGEESHYHFLVHDCCSPNELFPFRIF
jgi:hypothetical protein